MYSFLVDGGRVAVPDFCLELVSVEKFAEGLAIEADLFSGVENRLAVARRLLFFKVLVAQDVDKIFLFSDAGRPQHGPLGIDGLPVGLDAVVQLDADLDAKIIHAPLDLFPSHFRVSTIAQQTLVPRGFLSFGSSRTGQVRSSALVVAEKAVRVSRHVDNDTHVLVLRVEQVQPDGNVLLADVPVGSLRARDEVGLQSQHARPRRSGPRSRQSVYDARHF